MSLWSDLRYAFRLLVRSPVLRDGEAAAVMRVAQAQLTAARRQVDEVAAIPKADRTPERLMGTVRVA